MKFSVDDKMGPQSDTRLARFRMKSICCGADFTLSTLRMGKLSKRQSGLMI